MYKLKYITLLLTSFFIFQIGFSQNIPQNEKLIKGMLENGMTYYIYPNDYPKNEAVYRLFIKSGSIFEEEQKKGLAHFLEHMAFNGTKNFPKNELINFLETKGAKFGADINAHTSYNETVYKLQVPTDNPDVIDSTLLILSDWADGISIKPEDVEDERGVIMAEWLSKRDSKQEVNDALLDMLLNNSRFSERVVIGDTAVIINATAKDLRDYYESWYRPDLMAVAVVGDINADSIEYKIKENFSNLSSKNRGKIPEYDIPNYDDVDAKIIINNSLKSPELMFIQLGEKTKSVINEEDYIPYLERNLINRLFKNRISDLSFENTSYTKGSIGFSDFLNTKSILMGSVTLIPGKTKEGIEKFIADINQVYKYGFTDVEIGKIKNQYLNSLQLKAKEDSPTSSSTLMKEVNADFYKGHVVTTPKEEYNLATKYINYIDSLSILTSLNDYIDINKTHYLYTSFNGEELSDKQDLISLVNRAFKAKVTPYLIDVDLTKELLPKSPQKGEIIKRKSIDDIEGTELTLSNGAKVLYKPSVSGKNRINISAFKKGGLYALDSTDYVSGLFAPSIVSLSGAGSLNRSELSYYLAGNSASVRLLIEKTRAGMVGSSSLDDVETLFELMYAKWVTPNADREVFDITKKMAIENYQKQNKTEKDIFYEDLGYLMRSKNYVTDEMTDSRIEKGLDFEKVIPVFNSSFGNAYGFTFVIISDASIEELTPFIETYIASLPSYETNLDETKYKYKGGDTRKYSADFIRKASDSERAVVSLIFQRTDIPDNFDLYQLKSNMADDVIKIRLIDEIREKMGLIYSVNVSTGSTIHPSDLSRSTISFSASPDDLDVIINKIEQILDKMVLNSDSFDIELEKVKINQKQSILSKMQSNLYWTTFMRNTVFNEQYNWSYHLELDNVLDSITTSEISDLISKNFNINNRIKAILLPK